LIVPVLRHADQLTLRELSTQARDLAGKARRGGLMPDDYTGGSFTISNIGMFGVTSFNPIINQPESMILGVCAITQQLVMNDNGTIVKRMMMGLSLTFDHRALDGAQAAAFLKRIVTLMENPFEMMI
jgi:pyruvate dehydrogenase E2 component (dihydrolipoamide acetyltransferase)